MALSRVSELHALIENDRRRFVIFCLCFLRYVTFSHTSIIVQVLSFCPNADGWKYGTCAVADDGDEKTLKKVGIKAYDKITKAQWDNVNIGDVIRIERPWKYYERGNGSTRKSYTFNDMDFVIKLHANSRINVIEAITKEIIDSYAKIQSTLKGVTVIGEVHAEPEKEKSFFIFSIKDKAGKIMEVKMKKHMDLEYGQKVIANGKTSIIGKFCFSF